MAKSMGDLVGSWAYLVGLILAVLFGLMGLNATVSIVLVVAGLLVGLLNVGDKEVSPFLMSGAVLIIAASLGKAELAVIPQVADILGALLLVFVPATVIVAVKNVFSLAKR